MGRSKNGDSLRLNDGKLGFQNFFREMGLFFLMGSAAVLGLIIAFATLADEVFSNEALGLDRDFALSTHSLANPVLDLIFNFFTNLGGYIGITVLATLTGVLLLRKKHYLLLSMAVLAVGGAMLLNGALKLLYHRARPDFFTLNGQKPETFSFPSGHSMASACFFGLLIWLGFQFNKNPLFRTGWFFLMLFSILMVGLSRIYLGVHYLTDVLGGYIGGFFWLFIVLVAFDFYERRKNRLPLKLK